MRLLIAVIDAAIPFLRDERLRRGLTQKDVAKMISDKTIYGKITQSMISEWETGVVEPTLFNFRAWANALDIDIVMTPRR